MEIEVKNDRVLIFINDKIIKVPYWKSFMKGWKRNREEVLEYLETESNLLSPCVGYFFNLIEVMDLYDRVIDVDEDEEYFYRWCESEGLGVRREDGSIGEYSGNWKLINYGK